MKLTSLLTVAAALSAASVISCTKENINSSSASQGQLCTIRVAPDATKSAYDPETGKISLDHKELMALFDLTTSGSSVYYNYFNHKDGGASATVNTSIKADPQEEDGAYSGSYTFTKPDNSTSDWMGVIPYSNALIQTNGGHTGVWVRLSPDQFPEQNSFDPHCDFLMSKPFTVTGGEGTITEFKRLFAPLRLDISGLESGDKASAVTFFIGSTPDKTGFSTLIGTFYINNSSDSYSDAKFTSVEAGSIGNGVSAIYSTPLEATDGVWPVWFMVNPITIPAGTDITVTVTTATKTYTRTATTSQANTIEPDKKNILAFNIAGDGASSSNTIAQSFVDVGITGKSQTLTLTDSDGSSYDWTVSGPSKGNLLYTSSSSDNGSGLPNVLRLTTKSTTEASLTIPTISGKKITAIRIFSHPVLGNKTAATLSLYESGGTTALESVTFSVYSDNLASGIPTNGGYVDITLPDGYESLAGMKIVGSAHMNLISAIVMTVEDNA